MGIYRILYDVNGKNWLINAAEGRRLNLLLESIVVDCKFFDGYDPTSDYYYSAQTPPSILVYFGSTFTLGYGTNFDCSYSDSNLWTTDNNYYVTFTISSVAYGPYNYKYTNIGTGGVDVPSGYFSTNVIYIATADYTSGTNLIQYSIYDFDSNDHSTLFQSFDAATDSIYVQTVGCYELILIANYYSLVLNHGQAWAWGYGEYGGLGVNSLDSYSTPVAVCGNHTFCSINASSHSLGLDNNGQAWSWGYNYNGDLGVGENYTTSKSTPVAVCGNHTFCSISAGNHSFGLDNNGQSWSWGNNNNGQLGDGTTVNRCTPVSVIFTF